VSDFLASLLAAVEATLGDYNYSVSPTPPQWTIHLQKIADRARALDVPKDLGIAAIRAADPDFELSAFLVHIGEMFAAYHAAVDLGELKPARRFIDERAWEKLAEATKRQGRRAEGPRALTVKAIRPVTAAHEDGLDMVRILISANVAGEPDVLCEYWEVVRNRETRTRPGLDLFHCPNCGAPITGDDPTRCAYCNERLADPAFGWVVRKITAQ
jgi:hypothetical protein